MPTSQAEIDRAVAWLGAVRFCAGLDAEQIQAIASQIQVQLFTAGETLAAAGDAVTEFWMVVEGELDSFMTDPRGREKWIGTVRQGETVGELAILENMSTRPIRFTARTHGTLLVAPAALLHEWVKTYPQIMQSLFHTLSERFKAVTGAASRALPSPRLGIVATSSRGCVLAGRLAARLLAAGERLRAWACQPSGLRLAGSWPDALVIQELAAGDTPLLQPPTPEVDRQIVVWSPGSDGRTDFQQLRGCDEVLWLLEPRDAAKVSQDLVSLNFLPGELAQKVRLVWLLDADRPVAPLLTGFEFKKADVKVAVGSTAGALTRQECLGLDRLVRVLRGISVGIALAGGGAKGMAHFGVLHALEQAGLSFDVMSGTSAGAMAGILYASGMPPEQAIKNFEYDLTPSRLFRYLPKWPNWYLVSQYRRRAWDGMLRKYLHDWRLEQLLIPFNAVTVDLVQVRPVVRRQGDAVHAILESINLPIVSKPILRDGMALVDGGVLNNLPADVLAESGVDFVVGVDVSSRVRPEFAGNRPDMPTGQMRDASALDTLFRIFESQAHNIGKLRNRAVDFWIKPDTSRFGLAEFHRTAEIAAVGEAAALDAIAELKQRLSELEKRLLEQSQWRAFDHSLGRSRRDTTRHFDNYLPDMTLLARLFVGLIVVPTTIWIALAVYYHVRRPWLRWVVSLMPVVAVGASLGVLPLVPWALAVWLGMLVIAIAWWFSLHPRLDRDWAVGMEAIPRTEIVGDTLHVRHFRNFSYTAAGDPIPRYEERNYDLAKLSSLDYFLSHWSGPVMAHTLVSFGFDDGQFLCVSVEARRQRWQRYSPLWGLFRSYELMFVLGDERDIVRLRTNIRRERVYMYRLRLPPQNLLRLLLDYVRRVEILASQPKWYNSVTSNCTTNLFYQGHARVPWWMKPGIFLNGFSARTMYRLGFLSDDLPFKELQASCAIRKRALAAGDAADFSRRIRSQIILP